VVVDVVVAVAVAVAVAGVIPLVAAARLRCVLCALCGETAIHPAHTPHSGLRHPALPANLTLGPRT
jgi:hypothetical protein